MGKYDQTFMAGSKENIKSEFTKTLYLYEIYLHTICGTTKSRNEICIFY